MRHLRFGQEDGHICFPRAIPKGLTRAVPTTSHLNIRTDLSMVDELDRLGISLQFDHEIRQILERAYRCWLENDEEVYLDVATCAMAFRILRMHGYDVSSDSLSLFDDVRHFKNTVQAHVRDLNAIMELYKASQIQISPDERVLKKINSWATQFLKEELNISSKKSLNISQKVDYALRFPFYANLDRLEHKKH